MLLHHPTGLDQLWRPNRLGALAGYLVTIVFAAIGVAVAVRGLVGVSVLLFITAAVAGLATWRCASVPFIASSPEGIVVQNPLLRRTIPWQSVRRIQGGYYGLRITTKEGDTVIAWAVQKSNVAKWTKRRTRADRVATALLARKDR